MEKKPSASNTKNEILEAYNELLKKLEGQKSGQPKEIKEKEERDNVLKNAVFINKEGIIKQNSSFNCFLIQNPIFRH